MKRVISAKLTAAAENKTLLDYLTQRFNYHSCELWQRKISDGELSINGVICKDFEAVLHENMVLQYAPQDLIEPSVNTSYKIIYEDEHLVVIDKPGNLPVHPAGPYFNNTLWVLLQENEQLKVHFVNRLDRETSGILIAAKNPDAAGSMAAELKNMRKKYFTVVHGTFPQELSAGGFLCKDTRSPIRKKQRFVTASELTCELAAGAVEVKTSFQLIKRGNGLSLLSAELFTGRMHQIRATLCSLGFPVAGDKLYGLDEQFYRKLALDTLTSEDRAALMLDRQALHCAEMSFLHPASGKEMTFKSPLPGEFAALLD